MRRLVLLVALAFAPSLAVAQHTCADSTPTGQLLDLNQFITRGIWNQWSATRPAALAGLSKPSRQWIKDEVQRQAVNPRSPAHIALDVERVLAKDINRMARNERLDGEDIAGAVLLKVLMDTRNALAREANRAEGVTEEGFPAWESRIAQADGFLRDAVQMQSSVSVAMARD